MTDKVPNRSEITFAQAEGVEELPRQLALREVSQHLRSEMWMLLHSALGHDRRRRDYADDLVSSAWENVFTSWYVTRKYRMIDEINFSLKRQAEYVKSVMVSGDYVSFFDLLQFLLRHNSTPRVVRTIVPQILERTRSAYRVVDGTTIAPIGSDEEAAAIDAALSSTKESRFHGARKHLKLAAERLTAGEWADSVRESIHSVESVAVVLAPGTDELGPALTAIERAGKLHGALKDAFKKLYGFTSDDEGIRHALVLKDAPSVDEADAMFMLGACASFVTFLISRAGAPAAA